MTVPIRSCAKQNAKFVDGFDRWLLVKNYAYTTRREYLRAVYAFAVFLGPNSIATAESPVIRAFLVEAGCTPGRFQRIRVSLCAFYRFLTFAGVVRASPMQLIPRPHLRPRPLPRCLTESQVERLISATHSTRDRALVELLFASGLRASEAASLCIEDLDLDAGTLRVKRGKGDKERVAIVGSKAVAALRSYLGSRSSGPVFENVRSGGPLSTDWMRLTVADAGNRAGLPRRVGLHTLRHTFATVLLNRGADLRYVQELLGHERVSTTAIYTHTAAADLMRVYARCHPHAKGDHDAER